MRRSASHVATLIFALAATTWASAAIRRDTDFSAPPAAEDSAAAPAPREGRINLDRLFVEHGIAPDSNKARIIVTWMDKILRDPVIAARIPGGPEQIEQIFVDPKARETFMAQGLAHLQPSDRLAYMQLLTRFFDELVPVNCFGQSSMSEVMSRVSLLDMKEPDVDQYFNLLYRVLAHDTASRPAPIPTQQENIAAERAFSHSVIAELRGDQVDIDRFVMYASNPASATPSDICWATRVTLHAILAMPAPERDVVLLRTNVAEDRRNVPSAQQSGAPDVFRAPPAR
jgi:hypothetical protein